MSWHPASNVLFATTTDSELWMWKIPHGDSKIYSGHGEQADTAAILPDGRRVIVGYGDGSMRLFDLKSGEVLHNLTGSNNAHSMSVTTLDAREDNSLVASGGSDGMAKLHNVGSGKTLASFVCGGGAKEEEEEQKGQSVEAVLFTKSEQNFLVTGSLDGVINVWDLATQVIGRFLQIYF